MKTIPILLLFICLCPASAEFIIIEADDYDVGGYQVDMSPIFPQFDFYGCNPATVYAVESVHGGQLGLNVLGCSSSEDYWTKPAKLYIKVVDGLAKSVSVLVNESTMAEYNTTVWLKVRNSSYEIIEETYVTALNPDNPPKLLSITRDDYEIMWAEIYPSAGSMCLDHIEILLNPKQTLTVLTEPNFINTVDPNCGDHICHLNDVMPLSATDYVDCPNTYRFDYWEGDVNDPYSADTTIIMDSNEIVTACFIPTAECNDMCHPISRYDFNADCYIDFEDFAYYAENWLSCTHPDCD